jgi:hypothetical protein
MSALNSDLRSSVSDVLANAQMDAAIVGGLISGVLVLGGVLLSEIAVRSRERASRRAALITELTPRLRQAAELAGPGGILAVSPGSAQGIEALIEVIATFGLVNELLSTASGVPWGWRKKFRQQCLWIAALMYIACMDPPLNAEQAKQLNAVALREASGHRANPKGFDAVIRRARAVGAGVAVSTAETSADGA